VGLETLHAELQLTPGDAMIRDATIRDATAADMPALTAIFNDVVLHSTAVYIDEPVTLEDRTAWWQQRVGANFPVLVALDEATGDVVGFGTFGDFSTRSGYRYTAEGTILLTGSARGKGLGTRLLDELVERAKQRGMHTLIARVDSENQAALRLLDRYGFQRCGELREAGRKFDRWLNVVYLQLFVTAAGAEPRQ
jgi:L-amino acid N-acyltransferase YncA